MHRWSSIGMWALIASCAAAAPSASPPPSPVASADPVVQTSSTGRKLVSTAYLIVEIDSDADRRGLNDRARTMAKSLGGYLASEGTGGFVLRVPSGQMDQALERIPSLGDVVEQRLSVEEVTERHVDLSSRIKNLERLRDRLQKLLEKAESIKDILAIETELGRVTGELESLQAKLRVLDDQIQLATIHVDYRDEVSPGPIGWVFYGLFAGIKWLFVWD